MCPIFNSIALRCLMGMPVLWIGVGEHQGTTVEVQVDVHRAPFVVRRHVLDRARTECLLIEGRRLGRIAHLRVRHDPAEHRGQRIGTLHLRYIGHGNLLLRDAHV
jgi:hypothetical protein